MEKIEPWCNKGFGLGSRGKLRPCVHVRHGWDRDGAMEGSSGKCDKPKEAEQSMDP